MRKITLIVIDLILFTLWNYTIKKNVYYLADETKLKEKLVLFTI